MRGLAVGAALALTALFPMKSRANFVNGNDLQGWCQSQSKADQGICRGFVVGVIDMIQSGKQGRGLKVDVCFPESITLAQAMDVATKWLTNHPQNRHFVASDLVKASMEEAFPCRK